MSYLLPASWQEAKMRELVDSVSAERDVFERIWIVREWFEDYARLIGADLLLAREVELERDDAERLARLVEILRVTAPRREAIA